MVIKRFKLFFPINKLDQDSPPFVKTVSSFSLLLLLYTHKKLKVLPQSLIEKTLLVSLTHLNIMNHLKYRIVVKVCENDLKSRTMIGNKPLNLV